MSCIGILFNVVLDAVNFECGFQPRCSPLDIPKEGAHLSLQKTGPVFRAGLIMVRGVHPTTPAWQA